MNVKPDFDAIRLDAFLPYKISLLADQIARRTAAVAKRHNGLNLSQWRVMAAVADRPGSTANEVVAVTPMDKGIVSRAVKSLIELNLISRKASKADGRVGHLFLTPKGARLYQSMASEIRSVDEDFRSSFTRQDYEVLQQSLSTLIATASRR